MKRLYLSAAVILMGIATHAQDAYNQKTTTMKNNFRWSVGVEPSLPVGHFHDLSSFGIGGSFQGEYQPGKVGITLNAGYITYFGKTVDTINYADFKYWPIMGGLKWNMSSHTYLHGQLGAGIGEKNLGTSFWYGAGVGFDLGKALDLELRYMGWKQNTVNASTGNNNGYGGGTGGGGTGGYGGHYSTLGARLAYVFK